MKFNINEHYKSKNINKIEEMFGIVPKEREIFKNPDLTFLENSQICYITGPSGSGKSVLGRLIQDTYQYKEVEKDFDVNVPIIDALDLSFSEALSALNMAGLSEAYLYLTPYEKLSTGQKFRFELAFAMTRDIDKILIDEYTAFLDRETAKIVSYMLQKIVRKGRKKLVIITGNDDLEDCIMPDIVVRFDDFSKITVSKVNRDEQIQPFENDFTIKKGNYDDLFCLEKYHYFNGVKKGTLIRRNAEYYSLYYKDELMGVLVTTSPYANTVSEENLMNINNSLRIIFRIIIHPKIRGIGGTRFLYNHILTKEKKILFIQSAMAVEHPFLSNLGMIELSYVDYKTNNGYQFLQQLVESDFECEDAFSVATKLLGKTMWIEYVEYANLIGTTVKLTDLFFDEIVQNTFDKKDDLLLIMDILKPIAMRRYYYDNRL